MKFLTWGELQEANRRAIRAKCSSIDPEYVLTLPREFHFPIFFALPHERHGWMRCRVCTGVSSAESDYTPCLLDVPQCMYDCLGLIVVMVEDDPESFG